MTDKPTATAGPPPTVDIQDPLPESNFLWRRVFSFAISTALIGLLALVVMRIEGADELRRVALYLCILLWTSMAFYMLAPSAEQVVKMIQTARMLVSGVNVRQTATAQNETGTVTTQTTVSSPAADAAIPPRPVPPAVPKNEDDAAPSNLRG